MADMLDRNNQHLFLHEQNNKGNSFIANVNLLARNYPDIQKLVGLFDKDKVDALIVASKLNAGIIADDLEKGSLNGFRKLDIDLLTNFKDYDKDLTADEKLDLWTDPEKQLYYDSITVIFTDKTSIYRKFQELGVETPIWNHHQLRDQLDSWPEFKAKANYTMFDIVPNESAEGLELLRLWDGEDSGSYVQRIILHVADKGYNQAYDSYYVQAREYEPSFTWLDTTSTLVAIANSVNRLLTLSDSLGDLLEVCSYLPELNAIYTTLDQLASTDANRETIYKNLGLLKTIYEKLAVLESVKNTDAVLREVNSKFASLEKNKANKINTTVSTYKVTGYDIVSNYTYDYHLGDKLKCGDFTFVVTATNDEGRITKGNIIPSIVSYNQAGYYEFVKDNIFSIDIHCEEVPSTTLTVLDLEDVYNEHKRRLDATAQAINSISHRLIQLEELAQHDDFYDALDEINQALALKLDIEVFLDYTEEVAQKFAEVDEALARKVESEDFHDYLNTVIDSNEALNDTVNNRLSAVNASLDKISGSIDKSGETISGGINQSVGDLNTQLVAQLDTLTRVIANKTCGSGGSGGVGVVGAFAFFVDEDGFLCLAEAGAHSGDFLIDDNGYLEVYIREDNMIPTP